MKTETKVQHTQGNWHVQGKAKTHLGIYSGETKLYASKICDIWVNDGAQKEAEANAAFIVTACNNYYPMLEALKEIVNNCYTFEYGMKQVPNEFIAAAKAVIKAAEQENQ